MIKIQVPATSANLGVGFDCLGIAFNLYNTFLVEPADEYQLINVDEAFNNEDNLFLKAYKKGCEKINQETPIRVEFDCAIPFERGLGSSATLIIGGLLAASALHNNILSKEDILSLAVELEGHPDNVAPCLEGGLVMSSIVDGEIYVRSIPIKNDWNYTLFIPDFTTSTEEARKILPDSYPKEVVFKSVSNALLAIEAFRDNDFDLLKVVEKDELHEPYRKTLINGFDELKENVESQGGILLISGSGPTCLYISPTSVDASKINLPSWKIVEVKIDQEGAKVTEA